MMVGRFDERFLEEIKSRLRPSDVIGRTVKFQTKVVDNDTHVFSIYDLHAGDDYKVVEVTYKRRK